MKIKSLILIASVLSTLSSIGFGQNTPSSVAVDERALGIVDVYRIAQKNDQELRAASYDYLASKKQADIARAALLPQIALQYSSVEASNDLELFNTNGALQSSSSSTNLAASVNVPLLDIESWRRYRSGVMSEKAGDNDFELAQDQFILRVLHSYLDVLAGKDRLEAAKAREGSFKKQLDRVKQRFRVGIATANDREESQAGYDQAISLKIAQELDLDRATWQLYSVTGYYMNNLLPLCSAYQPSDDSIINFDINEQLNLAKQKNPLLNAVRHNVKALELQAKSASAARYPKISLGLTVVDNTLDSMDVTPAEFADVFADSAFKNAQADTLSLTLSMPIFTGGAITAQASQAWSRYRAANSRLNLLERQHEAKFSSAIFSIRAAKASVDASLQALKSADLALKATQSGYDTGIRNVVDLVRSADNYYNILANYSISRYVYLKAIFNLYYEIGELDDPDIEWIDGLLDYGVSSSCQF